MNSLKEIDNKVDEICGKIIDLLKLLNDIDNGGDKLSKSIFEGIIDELIEQTANIQEKYWQNEYNFHIYFVNKPPIIPPEIEIDF